MTVHAIGEAFQAFPKIARLARDCVISEKIDGSNAQVSIQPLHELSPVEDVPATAVAVAVYERQSYAIYAGSRSRWLQPGKATDNFGFAGWVKDNAAELVKLGPGRHYGEWWGQGINRAYGLKEKRFSLFNVGRWHDRRENVAYISGDASAQCPPCCHVVPVLYSGEFDTEQVRVTLDRLSRKGSVAAPGFYSPEGVIVFHAAANVMFKRTIEDDAAPKSVAAAVKVAA